ncbi:MULTISPECIES: hypothetical protein [unclassified Coleofasciculus]|uniref:hypothetical protein n=1 Tax=unclassified Coleofasciculus TaxID=2692782 RepID=UPI001D1454AC|nr:MULTISPECIES: hypothetical protein [unclassified Coleofasciculus]
MMNVGNVRSGKKVTNPENAKKMINSIKLLSKKDFMNFFPDASLYEEKFWGLTKSFIVYGGW